MEMERRLGLAGVADITDVARNFRRAGGLIVKLVG
jgi:hypothetical protein